MLATHQQFSDKVATQQLFRDLALRNINCGESSQQRESNRVSRSRGSCIKSSTASSSIDFIATLTTWLPLKSLPCLTGSPSSTPLPRQSPRSTASSTLQASLRRPAAPPRFVHFVHRHTQNNMKHIKQRSKEKEKKERKLMSDPTERQRRQSPAPKASLRRGERHAQSEEGLGGRPRPRQGPPHDRHYDVHVRQLAADLQHHDGLHGLQEPHRRPDEHEPGL